MSGLADTVKRLAVVAYPTLSDEDRQWIEGIRARYDRLVSRIATHFTLVFPTEVAEAPVVARVGDARQSLESIPVVLWRAAAFPDAIGSGSYCCLLAEEGHPELLALHEMLYEGLWVGDNQPRNPTGQRTGGIAVTLRAELHAPGGRQ